MRTLFTGSSTRHGHGSDCGRVSSPKERGQYNSPALFRDFLQNVTAIRNRADRNDHEPSFEGIDVEARELLVRQRRKDDSRDQHELGEGEDFPWGCAARNAL